MSVKHQIKIFDQPTCPPSRGLFALRGNTLDNTVLYIGGAVAGAIGTVAWWAVRAMHARISENAKDLADYKLYAEKRFVTSDELTKAIDNLEGTIGRLIESVNANATEMREWFRTMQQTKADK